MRPEFDPKATAEAEYEFWRAHNEKDEGRLRAALQSWTSELYGVDADVAAEAVAHLAEASGQHDVRDWDKAAEHASRYYAVILEHTELDFDPVRAGELEVAWWRIHDELEFEEDKARLVEAFQALYGEVFGLTPDEALEMAAMHAMATHEHDRAEADGVSEEAAEKHWRLAKHCLVHSYIAFAERGGT